jgi:hypothetical protein
MPPTSDHHQLSGITPIDEALAQIDMAWTVLMLVNWGDKSAAEAIAHVNVSELRELSEK